MTEDLVASTLSMELGIPHLVARFLVSRGYKSVGEVQKLMAGSADDVLSPWLMLGMDRAIQWIMDVRGSLAITRVRCVPVSSLVRLVSR